MYSQYRVYIRQKDSIAVREYLKVTYRTLEAYHLTRSPEYRLTCRKLVDTGMTSFEEIHLRPIVTIRS